MEFRRDELQTPIHVSEGPSAAVTYAAPATTNTAAPCPVHEHVAPAAGVSHTGPAFVTDNVTAPAVACTAPFVEASVPQITEGIVEAIRVPQKGTQDPVVEQIVGSVPQICDSSDSASG